MNNYIKDKDFDIKIVDRSCNIITSNSDKLDSSATCNKIYNTKDENNNKNYNNKFYLKKSLTILVIDDEHLCLDAIDIGFTSTNHKLILIKDSIVGLSYIKSNYNDIDIIVLDLMMPGMSGMEILEIIKQDMNTKSIPVIISTASSDVEIMRKCKTMGAEYLRKPYGKDSILQVVRKLCYVSIANIMIITGSIGTVVSPIYNNSLLRQVK